MRNVIKGFIFERPFKFVKSCYHVATGCNIRDVRDKDAESIRRASEERGGAKSGTDSALSSADFTTRAHDQCMNGAHAGTPTRAHARRTHSHTHVAAAGERVRL